MARRNKDLETAAKTKDTSIRALRIAAVLTRHLKKHNIHPVLVGGAAVEFYTQGGYATQDIDLVADHSEALIKTMVSLGFKREERYFVHRAYKILIKFPSSSLGAGEKTIGLDMDGEIVRIISIEDLVIDRLNAAKWGKSEVDFLNAVKLLNQKPNLLEVREKARTEDVVDVLDKALRWLKTKL